MISGIKRVKVLITQFPKIAADVLAIRALLAVIGAARSVNLDTLPLPASAAGPVGGPVDRSGATMPTCVPEHN